MTKGFWQFCKNCTPPIFGGAAASPPSGCVDLFNATKIYDKENGSPEDPIPEKIDFVISLMELIVGNLGLTAPERSLIDRAAKNVYEKFIEFAPTLEKVIEDYIEKNNITNFTALQLIEKSTKKELEYFNQILDEEIEKYKKKCRF